MKLKWTNEGYQFAVFTPQERKSVAELWDTDTGRCVALVVRADAWPNESYEVLIRPPREFDYRTKPWSEPHLVQGDFLQAQAFAIALATMND